MANLTQQNTTIAKLYTALFNRAPDAAGFTFWVQAYENGASLATLAQSFLTSPEALAIYPTTQTDTQFVTAFYTSVFGRGPDPEGLAFWAAALASSGGSASPAARSLLIQQITEVVATPLSTKPAGISDTAYAQTVADRAMFANKIEFGVYFATELKSNDTTLAKSTMLLVTNIPGSLAAARELATGGPAPVPTLAITSADLVADIIAKLAAYPGSSGTVDALNMSAAQLAAVAAGTSKIAANGITNLTLPVGDALITDTFATALLGKTSAAKIDATGADSAKLILLSTSLANVADEGIIGTLGLNDGLSIAQLTTLLGAKTGLAANVQVNATTMDPTKLAVLTAAGAKVDGIIGALAFTSAINETDIGTLAGKYTGTTVVVNASTMTSAQLAAVVVVADARKITAGGITSLTLALNSVDVAATITLLSMAAGANVVATGGSNDQIGWLVTYLANIAANGITGTLAITSAESATHLTSLVAKYTGTDVTVNATGMSAEQLRALGIVAAGTKISAGGITSLSLSLAVVPDPETAGLLSKATGATVVATGGTAAEVASLVTNLGNIAAAGITGTLAITSAVLDTNITALLSKYSGTTATVNVTGMIKAQLDALLVSTAKIAATGITGTLALSTSEDAVAANLLAKAGAGTLNVVATDGTAAEVASLAANLDKIAANGITGTLAITNAVTDTDITALLAKYSGSAATANVTGMNKAQLDALLVSTAKISTTGITGTLALNASEDAVASELFSKSAVGALSVVATGATDTELTSLVSNISKIGSTGLSGTLSLTSSQVGTITVATLNAKLDTGANLTVVGTTVADEINVTGITNAVKVAGGVGADLITVKATDTVIIASTADSRSSFSDTDTTMANIEQITGFVNTGRIQLSTVNNAYGSFALTDATVVMPFMEAEVALTTGQTFADLYAAYALRVPTPTASSATELYAFIVTVTGSSSLNGRYLIINDELPALDSKDFIVSVGSAMLDSGTFVIV